MIKTFQIILVWLALPVAAMPVYEQKLAIVMIQTPSNAGYDQYYKGMYGLKTWLDKQEEWEEVEPDIYYNLRYGMIRLVPVPDSNWESMTLEFVYNTGGKDDNLLMVYVGHNALMEIDPDTSYTNCIDNMVFACVSDAYFSKCIDNTLVNTSGLMAPEAYAVFPAIMGWFNGEDEQWLRRAASLGYAEYQGISLMEARKLFNYSSLFYE